MEETFAHIPVLLKECMEGLDIKPDGVYVDGTTGGGGHSEAILKRLGEKGRLICFDQDEEALRFASKRLEPYDGKVSFVHSNFKNMPAIVNEMGLEHVDGILLDLGVSSFQLDTARRGFSYNTDAKLDMRMDRSSLMTAYDIVNSYSQQELSRILSEYGEERFAGRISERIVRRREEKKIESTLELAEIIRSAIPAKFRRSGPHPAKRSFQAIRIELNRELEVLQESLGNMIDLLSDHGRICVISFHSLEDRIVKNIFGKSERPCTCPPGFPVCVCGMKPKGRVLSRKAIVPTQYELDNNSRSKSSKLRIFERIIDSQV